MCLREPSNRQVVRKADIATFMEHLRLQAAPCTTSECAKALLNSCFEPANAVRVADPASLSTICSILDNKHDEELQAALTNIIQSICLQVERAASLCCLSLTVWLGMSYACEVPTSTTCTQFEACRYESRCSESCTPLQVCQPHQTPSASLVIVRALCTTAVTPAYFADLKACGQAQAVLQAKGREAVRSSRVVPALLRLLRTGSQTAQAAAAAALANLSCEPQSVRLIRRSDGILPLVQLLGCV